MRWWVRARALELGLAGHAANLDDGRVEVVAEGPGAACTALLELLTEQPTAHRRPGNVTGVSHRTSEPRGAAAGLQRALTPHAAGPLHAPDRRFPSMWTGVVVNHRAGGVATLKWRQHPAPPSRVSRDTDVHNATLTTAPENTMAKALLGQYVRHDDRLVREAARLRNGCRTCKALIRSLQEENDRMRSELETRRVADEMAISLDQVELEPRQPRHDLLSPSSTLPCSSPHGPFQLGSLTRPSTCPGRPGGDGRVKPPSPGTCRRRPGESFPCI